MIVERCSCLTVINYHQLSFTFNVFKILMIVDDSFSHLTVHMTVQIVYDSWTVDCHALFDPGLNINGNLQCCIQGVALCPLL